MRILVAGIYRSGSTWLFNAVKLIAEASTEQEFTTAFYQSEQYNYRDEEFVIVKTHKYYPNIIRDFDFIFTSNRDPLDIFYSMQNVHKKGISSEYRNASNFLGLNEFTGWLEEWNNHTDYCMEFEQMMEDKKQVLTDIADVMGVDVDINKIHKKLLKMKAPKQGHDTDTFMSEAHYKFQ